MNQVRGVGVTRMVKDSPAEKAGLRKDDVILRLDGENITSVRKLNRLVSEISSRSVGESYCQPRRRGAGNYRNDRQTQQQLLRRDFFKSQPEIWKWEGPRNQKI